MEITLAVAKDIFTVAGSAAGFFAVLKPLFESKSQRNAERYVEIRKAVPEQYLEWLVTLNESKQIYMSGLLPIDRIVDAWTKRMDISRFEGPFAARHVSALGRFAEAWLAFRDLLKGGPWKPAPTQDDTMLVFNRRHFETQEQTANGLAIRPEGIDEYWVAVKAATALVRNRFLVLQLTANLHMLELPFAGLLLRRKVNEVVRR